MYGKNLFSVKIFFQNVLLNLSLSNYYPDIYLPKISK
jgi:hypothetical protein